MLKGVVEKGAFDNLEYGPFLDTEEVTGLLLVSPESFQLPGQHFHCYALTLGPFRSRAGATRARVTSICHDERMRQVVALEPWRFLGIVEQNTTSVLNRDRSLLKPYVEAAVRYWPVLKAEGRRYGPFINEPEAVWQLMDNLKYSLANLGIAGSELQAEPLGGPAEFLARINQGETNP